MENLSLNELISINGGNECHPNPGITDPNVASGYGIGWHIGHAIGETVEMFGDIADSLMSWW